MIHVPTLQAELADLKPIAPYLRMKEQLLGDGFEPGGPSSEHWARACRIALRSRCGKCKQKGLLYLEFHRPGDGELQMVLLCPACGRAATSWPTPRKDPS